MNFKKQTIVLLTLIFCTIFMPSKAYADEWIMPFKGLSKNTNFPIGQAFGYDGGYRTNSWHNGLDFGSNTHQGSSGFEHEILAVHKGTVVYSGLASSAGSGLGALGTVVVIEDGGISVIYQEFGKTFTVKTGDKVEQGDVIAIRGSDHLHIGITKKDWVEAQADAFNPDSDTWIDPEGVLKGTIKLVGDGSSSSSSSSSDGDSEKATKYEGEDAWKNKMINFVNEKYYSTFLGINNGSTSFINNAFIVGLNKSSAKFLTWAYTFLLLITTGVFFLMFSATIYYLVVMPNGLGGQKLANTFTKITRVEAFNSRKNTLDLLGRLGITTVFIACLYANLLPVIASGFINVIMKFLTLF